MPKLVLASQKGGVGKTSVALNLALSFARRGWRTLLVDADPQGSIGLSLQGADQDHKGLTECLKGEAILGEAVLKTRVPELQILTIGHPFVSGEDFWRSDLIGETEFQRVLESISLSWDLTIVDTASGMYGFTMSVLRNSDYILVPIQAEPLSLRTIIQVLDAVGQLRQTGSTSARLGFLITMLNPRQEASLGVAKEIWNTLPTDMVLSSTVPRDTAFLNASAHGVPLGLMGRRPPAIATVFDQMAAEIEPHLGMSKEGEEENEPIPLLD